jgi:hypothetical protein
MLEAVAAIGKPKQRPFLRHCQLQQKIAHRPVPFAYISKIDRTTAACSSLMTNADGEVRVLCI